MRLKHTPGSICTSLPKSHSCLCGAQLTQGYSISGFRPDFSAGCGCSYLFFLTTLAGVLLTFSRVSHPEFLCSFFSPQGHTKWVLVKLACAQRMWRGLGTMASRNSWRGWMCFTSRRIKDRWCLWIFVYLRKDAAACYHGYAMGIFFFLIPALFRQGEHFITSDLGIICVNFLPQWIILSNSFILNNFKIKFTS